MGTQGSMEGNKNGEKQQVGGQNGAQKFYCWKEIKYGHLSEKERS